MRPLIPAALASCFLAMPSMAQSVTQGSGITQSQLDAAAASNLVAMLAQVPSLIPVQSVNGKVGIVSLVPSDISGLSVAAASAAPVQSVAGKSGAVILSSTDIAGLAAAASAASPVQSVVGRTGAVTLAPADISGFNAAASAAAPIQSIAGRTGNVSLTYSDIANAPSVNSLSGLTQYMAGTIFTSTADVNVSSTSDGTVFGTGVGSRTIPANAVNVGTKFRVSLRGNYTTPLANVATITVKVKYGSATISTATSPSLSASAAKYPVWFDALCTVRSIGAAGTMVCNGGMFYTAGFLNVSPVYLDLSTSSPQTINTTVSSLLDVTIAWSTVAGSQLAVGLQGSVEVVN